MNKDNWRIGIVGYGEVGKIFCDHLIQMPRVTRVGIWDLKFGTADGLAQAGHERPAEANVHTCASLRELCESSDLLISAVTASSTLDVAEDAAVHVGSQTMFLDLNSASPRTKQQCATVIEAHGASYVEAGVMASVPPHGARVPMLLGGSSASSLASVLQDWGMNVSVVSDKLGTASAIKMCRSIMIKGLEALTMECFTAARAYGVEKEVLASLDKTFPTMNWNRQGSYFFSRVAQHGQRRADEMRESARTVQDAGLAPMMAEATAATQQWMADSVRKGLLEGVPIDGDWQCFADALLAARSG